MKPVALPGNFATSAVQQRYSASVRPLQRQANLRETVTVALRSAIITGEMTPGTVYSAPTLSAQFRVSATPVREVMLDLVKEGLVVAAPNKGFRVTEISAEELDRITEIRLLLEPPSVAAAVPLIGTADLPKLRTLAQDIVDAVSLDDLPSYVEADRTFHLALMAFGGNMRLVELVSDLRSQTRLFGLLPLLESGQLVHSAIEHHSLVDLIEAGDANRVEVFMREHIGHVAGRWAGVSPPTAAAELDELK